MTKRLPLLRHLWQVPLAAALLILSAALVWVTRLSDSLALVLCALAVYPLLRSHFVWQLYKKHHVLVRRRSEIDRALPSRTLYFHCVFQHRASGMIFYINYHKQYKYVWGIEWSDWEAWLATVPPNTSFDGRVPCTVYRLNKHTGDIMRCPTSMRVRTNGDGSYSLEPSHPHRDMWLREGQDLTATEVFKQFGNNSLVLVERLGGIAIRHDKGVIGGVNDFTPARPTVTGR